MTCGHAFHKGCLDEWLQKGKNNCPVCRSRVGFLFDPPRTLLISLFREFQSTYNPCQLPNLERIRPLKGILDLLSKPSIIYMVPQSYVRGTFSSHLQGLPYVAPRSFPSFLHRTLQCPVSRLSSRQYTVVLSTRVTASEPIWQRVSNSRHRCSVCMNFSFRCKSWIWKHTRLERIYLHL